LFDVVLISDMSRMRLLRALPRVFNGGHVTMPEVEIVRATDVKLQADRSFTVFADGDPVSALPAHLHVAHGAVQVLAPDPATA
jgi:diacylglycerol kinase family enzyme